MNKYWNVTATLAILLVLVYVGIAGGAMLVGKLDFAGFQDAVQPVVMAALGYMAALLPRGTTNG